MLFVPTQPASMQALQDCFLAECHDRDRYQGRLARLASKSARSPARAEDRYRWAMANGLVISGYGQIGINLPACLELTRDRKLRFMSERVRELAQVGLRLVEALWQADRASVNVNGIADVLALIGRDYNSSRARRFTARVCRTIKRALIEESVRLAADSQRYRCRQSSLLHSPRLVDWAPKALIRDAHCYGLRHDALVGLHHDPLATLAFGNGISPGVLPISGQACRIDRLGAAYAYRPFARELADLHRLPLACATPDRRSFEQLLRIVARFADAPPTFSAAAKEAVARLPTVTATTRATVAVRMRRRQA